MAIQISYPTATIVTLGDRLLGTQYDSETGAAITKNFAISSIVSLAEQSAASLYAPLAGATFTGNVIAPSFIKAGGTASQFLKADGSVDNSVYALDNAVVHLTGNETIDGIKTFVEDLIVNGVSVGKGNNSVLGNTVVGANALNFNISGTNNTFVGENSGYLNQSGGNNVGVGFNTFYNLNSGTNNSALGNFSLQQNTTGYKNTAIGYFALNANTISNDNTAVGNDSLKVNTIGNFNTAVGSGSMIANTSGLNNVAIGYRSLNNNTTGNYNTVIGNNATTLAAGNSNSIVIGRDAVGLGTDTVVLGNGGILTTILRGQTLIGTTTVGAPTYGSTPQLVVANPFSNVGGVIDIRNLNTSIVADSLLGRIQFTGKSDALVGFTSAAIEVISTGNMGTGNNGGGALKFMTSPGTFPTNPIERMRVTQGGTVQPGIDNSYSLGASGIRWSAVWAANGTIQTSDEREKKDIVDSDLGLDFISKLRPVSFKWKVGKNEVTNELDGLDEEGNPKTKIVVTPIEGKRTHYGLIAQEVEAALDGKDFGGFIHDKETDIKGLRYDQLIPVMINAIKELKAEIELLKSK
jgi:hypothetical protein